MEGIVLVEMSSGALHYTKSFSDAFDARHPKTERLNFGALIFALQNFAVSSIRSIEHCNGPAANLLKSSDSAEIVMFTTPLETMVLATTPFSKLLVVLFTKPDFDVDIAKWVVRRAAFNYDNCDNAEMQLVTTLNQVPRRFRRAFSQAVDEAVERELIRLSESILIPNEEDYRGESFGGEESFLFFYYSPRLSSFESEGGSNIESGTNFSSEDECRNADRADNPVVSKKLSIRNIMASIQSIDATSVKRDLNTKKKSEKRSRWRSRNAVIDHSEPHEFQRVFEVYLRERKAALMDPRRTEKVCGIASVLLPFVEVSSISLDLTQLARSKGALQRSQKLNQVIWTNTTSSNEKQQTGSNVMAWRSGSCIIFYPITLRYVSPESNSRVRLAVTTSFDVLEPLLKAKMKTLA